jgi:hypothetical protein
MPDKMIQFPEGQLKAAKRLLERLEVAQCRDCEGTTQHVDSCPAMETRQLINYIGATINRGRTP